MSVATPSPRRELAHRVSGGIQVTLYWSAAEGPWIELWRAATEELVGFPVPPERALDAYHHPFAHLAAAPLREHDAVPL